MRVFDDVDAFGHAVGEDLGHSPWLSIDEERRRTFAESTFDPQLSRDGYLTLALVPPLLKQVYEVRNVAMSLNYGTNKIRFPSAVPVDARIRAHARLLATSPASIGHQFVIGVSVEREGSDVPVCVADLVLVLVGRE